MAYEKTINETIPEINYSNEEIRRVLRNNLVIDYFHNRELIEQLARESPLIQANSDLLEELRTLDEKTLEGRVEEAKAKSLLQLNLFTKARCDGNCDICYTFDLRRHCTENQNLELRINEIKGVIDQAREQGARAIYIAGAGEPFCDPNFLEIVDYSKKQGMNVVAFTNGLRLGNDKGLIKKIRKYDNLRLIGKVWHTNQEKNDQLVGVKYGYQKETLKNGRKINIPAYVFDLIQAGVKLAIETCVRPENYESVKNDLIPFCEENSLPFVLEGIFYGGKAKGNGRYKLSKEDVKCLTPHLINHCKRSQYSYAVSNIGEGSHCHANIRVDENGRIIINEENNIRYRSLFDLMHRDKESVKMRYLCVSRCPHYASYKWLRGENDK
jgi:organic radical activating enzyme